MKRFVCLFLSLLMVWSLCPVTLLAQALNGRETSVEGEVPTTTVEAVSPMPEEEGAQVTPEITPETPETTPEVTPALTPEATPSVEPTAEPGATPEVSVPGPSVVPETPTPSPTTEEDNIGGGGIKDLTGVAGSILKNTKYKDTFSKIADPIDAFADILGRLSQDAFNKELMEKIDKIQDTLETMETQIATENRRLESAINALSHKVDMQSYTAMMQEVKAIDGEVNYLYSDYKDLMASAETSSPQVTKANIDDWARRAENLNIDSKITRINAIMDSSQGTDSLLKAGRRVLTDGYPFEHQIRDPLYDMFLYTVGVRQRLLFLYSEYNHYKLAQAPNNQFIKQQYVTRYNSVIESINKEVEANQLDKIANPDQIKTVMELHNPNNSYPSIQEGYRVIFNANQKEYFMAESKSTLSRLYDFKTESIPFSRHDRATFYHGSYYPAQDVSGVFKLIDSTKDLTPLAENACQVQGPRFLDYLVQNGGLSDLSGCQALLTSDHEEGMRGPTVYGDLETVDGREYVYDANSIVYNELNKYVFKKGYVASSLGIGDGYHFGGEEKETKWASASLLIILESGGDGPTEDQTFTPTSPAYFAGDNPYMGLPNGKRLTIDFSQMRQCDMMGKKLHLSGRVTLDGGDTLKQLDNLSLVLEEDTELTIRNLDIYGALDESALYCQGGETTIIVKDQVKLDTHYKDKAVSGIKNEGSLTIKGERNGDTGTLASLKTISRNHAPGIANEAGSLTISDLDLTVGEQGRNAAIQSGEGLNIKGSKITTTMWDYSYCDIGQGKFEPIAQEQAIGTIESTFLNLGNSKIAGNIRVTSDCEYARNEAPYYLTLVHGGDQEDWPVLDGVGQEVKMKVEGSKGSLEFTATCRPATFENPETVAVKHGYFFENIGALEGVLYTTPNATGLMPQSLKVAVGSPYGTGENLNRIDGYRRVARGPKENPNNWFDVKDRVATLKVDGLWPDTVAKGLQVAFQSELTTQGSGRPMEYIPLSQCPKKDGYYYIVIGYGETNPRGLWFKRTDDGEGTPANLIGYHLSFLKEEGGKKIDRSQVLNQWMPLVNEPYFLSLDPEIVNAYKVSLALLVGSVPADDLIMEVEGQWGTVRIPLRKHLPKGTTFSIIPVTFNILTDTGLGAIKRLRLVKEGDTGKTAMVIKNLSFTFNHFVNMEEGQTVFTMANTLLKWNEWKNLQGSLAGVPPETKPETPKAETPADQILGANEPTTIRTKGTLSTSPTTGIPGTSPYTAPVFLAILGAILMVGGTLKLKKSK